LFHDNNNSRSPVYALINLYILLFFSEMTTTTYSLTRPPAHLSRQIIKSECAPPPLIAISETRKNLRKLPEYNVLFPRPSVIATTNSSNFMDLRYQYKCEADCKCKLTTTKFPDYVKKSTINSIISRDFELSLGEKYDLNNFNERPSSVDDHFAKALGNTWYTLGYGKCAST